MIDADKRRVESNADPRRPFMIDADKISKEKAPEKSALVIKNQRKSAYYSIYRYIFTIIYAGLAQHGG